ncbi:MAG: site-specific DNA-methyltransferase, partial [Chloroflexota bacterium]|nr:site-specific DNA-methyltransferase [Chloroflexota bacterium]
MTNDHFHEEQFFNALRDIFVGAKIEGESGFINLMRIKSRYYQDGVFPHLKHDIDQAVSDFPEFREELFDKLYTFFERYFSESGSIYFRYTPLHQKVYEQVYTNDRDVVLFWKTHMLYYVKTDRIFNSLKVEVDGFNFFFDACNIEHKRANEKRQVVFSFREVAPDGAIVFDTAYSVRGRITKINQILRDLRKEDIILSDETLEKAFRVFEKQSEVDYFINKNARAFLEEQFDLWMYQYLFAEKNIWAAERLAQLQALKEIAYKVIGFISQFEDELVKVWNKPKFVRNSHYIITLDHLIKRNKKDLLEALFTHDGMPVQIKEWVELGMLENEMPPWELLRQVTAADLTGEPLTPKWQTLPLDTRFFPNLEIQILACFEDLDQSLDGWLVHSENYQA